MKTINFFSFDKAEKVEDEVDATSGRCRRKNYPPIFSQNFTVSQPSSRKPVFSRLRHGYNQTVIGDNPKVYSLAVALRRLLVGAATG